ncbi:MAG: pilin [Candidatus Altiarchaeota archaeon]
MNDIWDIYYGVRDVATALGALVIANSGFRWIIADSPQEREDAKKTIIYVLIGLFFVAMTREIVQAVYCQTLSGTTYGQGIC